jgi:UDP-N-acetylmuramate--alanine ligase
MMAGAGTGNPAILADLGPVYIVGVGGAGMSGIARILLAQGVAVSGSDARDSRRLASLRALGAEVYVGHDASQLGAARTVVASTAIRADNVELMAARERGLRILTRAEALAALMNPYRGIAVAGTHGKTTTTSMLTVALQNCGADPSFAIGSELNESGSNAHLGTGPDFVAEADESDGTFLQLPAFAGIVTNVEPDHLDHWKTFEAIEQGFVDFALGLKAREGFLVACLDDPGSARLIDVAQKASVDVRTYGQDDRSDYRVTDMVRGPDGWRFEVVERGVRLGAISLHVPAVHNVFNATAALALGIGLGYPASDLRAGLEAFSGTSRRFEYKGTGDGVRVYDDYAHHPTEIAATLRAMREVVGEGRLVVAFQAHHYYRTALFANEFGQALGLADQVVVLEVFAPGEELVPGASGMSMAAQVPLPPDQVVFEPSWSRVAGQLADRASAGDLVMTLGAGDISMIGPEVLELLRAREAGRQL